MCIQLLKIIKFASALVPKMDLAPSVLKKALPDLVFFGVVFIISMVGFGATPRTAPTERPVHSVPTAPSAIRCPAPSAVQCIQCAVHRH